MTQFSNVPRFERRETPGRLAALQASQGRTFWRAAEAAIERQWLGSQFDRMFNRERLSNRAGRKRSSRTSCVERKMPVLTRFLESRWGLSSLI